MSCTLVLVPLALGPNVVGALITSLVASVALTAKSNMEFEQEIRNTNYNKINPEELVIAQAMNKNYGYQQMICSEYKTIFKDEKLLIKTLSEHNVENIVSQNGKIYGNLDALQFEFEKDTDGIYKMHITHKKDEDLSVVNDLNDEYQLNVQEQSYINIKQNLEKQNLKIDSEEVLEDNSIMLTVNLE